MTMQNPMPTSQADAAGPGVAKVRTRKPATEPQNVEADITTGSTWHGRLHSNTGRNPVVLAEPFTDAHGDRRVKTRVGNRVLTPRVNSFLGDYAKDKPAPVATPAPVVTLAAPMQPGGHMVVQSSEATAQPAPAMPTTVDVTSGEARLLEAYGVRVGQVRSQLWHDDAHRPLDSQGTAANGTVVRIMVAEGDAKTFVVQPMWPSVVPSREWCVALPPEEIARRWPNELAHDYAGTPTVAGTHNVTMFDAAPAADVFTAIQQQTAAREPVAPEPPAEVTAPVAVAPAEPEPLPPEAQVCDPMAKPAEPAPFDPSDVSDCMAAIAEYLATHPGSRRCEIDDVVLRQRRSHRYTVSVVNAALDWLMNNGDAVLAENGWSLIHKTAADARTRFYVDIDTALAEHLAAHPGQSLDWTLTEMASQFKPAAVARAFDRLHAQGRAYSAFEDGATRLFPGAAPVVPPAVLSADEEDAALLALLDQWPADELRRMVRSSAVDLAMMYGVSVERLRPRDVIRALLVRGTSWKGDGLVK